MDQSIIKEVSNLSKIKLSNNQSPKPPKIQKIKKNKRLKSD